jgi:outer membrane protein OmpA-like peptidoglycan-associated protein
VDTTRILSIFLVSSVILLLTSCYQPPFNNFKPHNYVVKPAITGTGVGVIAGAVSGNILIGTGIGAAAGTAVGLYKNSKAYILQELRKNDIEFIQYGDTITLIVPTDRYFLFNSARLNELCYIGLVDIIRLLKHYPKCKIYVAAFTDNIGSKYHKRILTQARAEAMVTFLWANGIDSQRLEGEGYSDKNNVAPNTIIHGSAFNRRIEIQCVNERIMASRGSAYVGYIK